MPSYHKCQKHTCFTLSWLALVVFLPVMLINGCASLPANIEGIPSYTDMQTAETLLGQEVSSVTRKHQNLSGFHAFPNGIEAYAARLRLIRNAEKTLDLQYFIWNHDLTGMSLFNRLLEAADRGVRVRLLLDDMDTAGKEKNLHIINAHPNVEIRLFNPFANRDNRWVDFLTDTHRVNRRMHNKSLIADNQAVILGGRNIGDEYFDAATEVGFADMDVLAIGPITVEISQSFDLYWNSQWTYPLSAFSAKIVVDKGIVQDFRQKSDKSFIEGKDTEYAKELKKIGLMTVSGLDDLVFTWGDWSLFYDLPDKIDAKKINRTTHLTPKLMEKMDEVQQELNIVSPYFVPGEKFTTYLTGLVVKGIHVRIITNSLAATDVSLVHAGYMRYRKALLKGGVELYEYKPHKITRDTKKIKWPGSSRGSLHGKILGFDDQYVFVGSFNMDARSVVLNTELGVYFESSKYATYLSDTLEKKAVLKCYQLQLTEDDKLEWVTFEDGQKITFFVEPETGILQRLMTRLFSTFVPERQL